MKNYFDQVVLLDEFKNSIEGLRKKYKVPLNGFDEKIYEKWGNSGPFSPPKQWAFSSNNNKLIQVFNDIDQILIKYEFYEISFDFILFEYFFFNTLEKSFFTYLDSDLCESEDRISEYNYSKNVTDSLRERAIKKRQKSMLQYPVAINVSPYASRNDIVDFINKKMKEIIYIQNKYKKTNSKIGRIRKRPTRIRDSVILEKESLPRKTIANLDTVKKIASRIDEVGVRNIISREKKRRKEV